MKQQIINQFKEVAKQVKTAQENPALLFENYKDDAGTLQRLAFFKACQSMGYSDELSAKVAMAVKIKVNVFDQEISDLFINEIFIPSMTMLNKYKNSFEVQKNLSEEDFILSNARGVELEYQF